MHSLQVLLNYLIVISHGHPATCDTTLKETFRDNFEAAQLDSMSWHTVVAPPHGELHCYHPDNIHLANGTLRIPGGHLGCEEQTGSRVRSTKAVKLIPLAILGPQVPIVPKETGWKTYSEHNVSERSYVMNKFGFKYGEVEIRANIAHWKNSTTSGAILINSLCASLIPDCKGRWAPSLTMFATKKGDPYTIELDVNYLDVHPASVRKDYKSSEDLSLAFHVYRLVWTETFLGWFIDGVEVFSVSSAKWIPSEPMQLVFQLDAEESFPTHPFNESDKISSTFVVDYVVVRQYLNESTFPNRTEIVISKQTVLLPVLVTVIPATVLVISGIYIVARVRRRRSQMFHGNMRKSETVENIVSKYLSLTICDAELRKTVLNYVRALEIPLANIHATDIVLGQGEFGIVRKGTAIISCCRSDPVEVAVKEPRDKANPQHVHQLIEEIKTMSKAGRHLNICNLLGVALKGETMLLLEFAKHGCLLKYLKHYPRCYYYNHTTTDGCLRPYDEMEAGNLQRASDEEIKAAETDETLDRRILSTTDLIDFAFQISRGMEYLNSRSIIHRDLAARNVLVSEGRILKISDFGMAKQMSEYVMDQQYRSCVVSQCALPVRWMPPEAIVDKVFSEKSDVWSFGIVIWEIFSFGEVPYSHIRFEQGCVRELIASLQNGVHLGRPDTCPVVIYDLMIQCWQLAPEVRPSFSWLRQALEAVLGNTTTSTYVKLDSCSSRFHDMFKECFDVIVQETDVKQTAV